MPHIHLGDRAFGPWGGRGGGENEFGPPFTPPFGFPGFPGFPTTTTTQTTRTTTTTPPAKPTTTAQQPPPPPTTTHVTTTAPEPTHTPAPPPNTPQQPPETEPSDTNTPSSPGKGSNTSDGDHSSRSSEPAGTSMADHVPTSSPSSGTVIYYTLSGSTVTVSETATSVAAGPTAAVAGGSSRGLNAGEKAAIAISFVFVALLSLVIWFAWRRKMTARDGNIRIRSPTQTISGGMIRIGFGSGAEDGYAHADGSTTSRAATIRSVHSSQFSTSASSEGLAAVAAATSSSYPNEKSPSFFATTATSDGGRSPSPPNSAEPLLSPHTSMPLISPISPLSPMTSMSHMSMAYGPANALHMSQMPTPIPGFPMVTSPTTAATERSPYAWDHPPPSSEYLPAAGPSSRRSTFRTSRYADSRGSGMGMPSPPYAGLADGEDARSERSAPPVYSRD